MDSVNGSGGSFSKITRSLKKYSLRGWVLLFLLLNNLIPFTTALPQSNEVQVTVRVKDTYLQKPLDSTTVILHRGAVSLDSAVTDQQGYAVLTVTLTGTEDQNPHLPESFHISNIYPNPFSDEAKVDGYFPEGGEVTVHIYNAVGEQVMSRRVSVGAGKHTFTINEMSELPKGIYFGVIQQGGQSRVVKMANIGEAGQLGFVHGFSSSPGNHPLETLTLTAERNRYQAQSSEHTILGDTLIAFEMLRENQTVVRAVTPNNNAAAGVRIKIDTGNFFTDADGKITRILLSGNHTISSNDIRFESLTLSPLIVSDTLFTASLTERIISTYTNPTLSLGDTLRINPASFLFGTGKDSLYAIASPTNFTVQGLTLIPKKSGNLPFSIIAKATGGTVREFNYTALVNPSFTLKLQYPDTSGISNLSLTVDGVAYTTNAQGTITVKQSGNLRVLANDPRLSGIDTLMNFANTATFYRALGKEKITFSAWTPSIPEDSTIVAPTLASFGTSGTYALVSLSPQLTVGGSTLIPSPNAFGSFPFKVVAQATHGTSKEQSYTLTVSEMRDIEGYVIDVQTLGKKQGVVKIGNTLYPTDAQGKFAFQITPTPKIDSLKAWVSSEFVATYRNVRTDADLMNLAIPVVTLDSLVAGSGIPDSLAVTPAEFRAYVQEGNFVGNPLGIKSIDFQNATNPVPNPNGPHGYVYWIDNNWGPTHYPSTFTTWTSAEREYVKQIIEQEVIAKIRDPSHRPSIYLAQPGEAPPLRTGVTGIQPINGILLVMHQIGGNGYNFGARDYDSDGLIDAANISIGEPVIGYYPQITQEAASVFCQNPVYAQAMENKTVFSHFATSNMTPADIKLLRIEEIISRVTDAYNPMKTENLPDGTLVTRLYFPTKVHVNDVLKQQ